jgi:hypothetical protein
LCGGERFIFVGEWEEIVVGGGGGVYTFWFNVLVRFRPFRIPLDVQLVVREDLQGSLLHLES